MSRTARVLPLAVLSLLLLTIIQVWGMGPATSTPAEKR
jgi:hypothetical protein